MCVKSARHTPLGNAISRTNPGSSCGMTQGIPTTSMKKASYESGPLNNSSGIDRRQKNNNKELDIQWMCKGCEGKYIFLLEKKTCGWKHDLFLGRFVSFKKNMCLPLPHKATHPYGLRLLRLGGLRSVGPVRMSKWLHLLQWRGKHSYLWNISKPQEGVPTKLKATKRQKDLFITKLGEYANIEILSDIFKTLSHANMSPFETNISQLRMPVSSPPQQREANENDKTLRAGALDQSQVLTRQQPKILSDWSRIDHYSPKYPHLYVPANLPRKGQQFEITMLGCGLKPIWSNHHRGRGHPKYINWISLLHKISFRSCKLLASLISLRIQ